MNLNEFYLFKKRTFLPLFLTQFCGAFNDNAFKLSILTLISYSLSQTQTRSEGYQILASALFILPFFIFSATAGQLADKYDKAVLTRIIKSFELILMLVGGFAFSYYRLPLMLVVLIGMGVHSTFFGPIKYAILADHLSKNELLPATAFIEASTFIAILLGTTLGALVVGGGTIHQTLSILMLNSFAVIGLIASFYIPKTGSNSPQLVIDWHLYRSNKVLLKSTVSNANVLPTILNISWFWLIGAVILTKLPDYVHFVLKADTAVFALFLSLFSIGIALGSLVISHCLAGKITLRYVPIAMFCLSIFALDLYWATPQLATLPGDHLLSLRSFLSSVTNLRLSLDFFLLAFCGGLFIVPLYTYLQVSCHDAERSRVIAANNIINSIGMVLGIVLVFLMLKLSLAIPVVFLVLAILNGVVSIIFGTKTKTMSVSPLV